MRWIEIIHLRPMEASASAVLAHIANLQPELSATPALQARVFLQTGLGFDVAVHLAWHDGRQPEKSPLGLAIAESLRGFGLVDHSTWKEATP